MLALPSNPDSYELSFRFFFFSNWLKFFIVWNTDVPSYELEPNMPTWRLCDILVIPMAFPAFACPFRSMAIWYIETCLSQREREFAY